LSSTLIPNANIADNATTNATAKAKHPGNKASTCYAALGRDVALPAHTDVQHAVVFLIKGPQHYTIR
jgi:hypothetical protein